MHCILITIFCIFFKLRADIAKLNITLMKADVTSSTMAKTADMVERLNNENRQNLANAESATTKAVADANQASKVIPVVQIVFVYLCA